MLSATTEVCAIFRSRGAEISQLPKETKCAHNKWVKFLKDYMVVLKHKTRVENKVTDALSRRVMNLVAMSAEVTGFERLREEYDHVLTLGKFTSCYEKVLFERWTNSCYKTDIYSGSVSYVFLVRPSGTFSLGKCM